MKIKTILIATILLISPIVVLAHPGRTDSSGCHTCRTNCASWGLSTGEYHCHQAKSTAPQPIEPVKSKRVEGGQGITVPAPEYKTPKEEPKENTPRVLGTTNSNNNSDDSDSNSSWLWWLLGGGGLGYFIKYKIGNNKASK